jgi:hypothetical protein
MFQRPPVSGREYSTFAERSGYTKYADQINSGNGKEVVVRDHEVGTELWMLFVWGGAFLFAIICIVPIWNSLRLLLNPNYIFWFGSKLPSGIIAGCLLLILLYVVAMHMILTCGVFKTDHTVLLLTVVILFAIMFVTCSLPLFGRTVALKNDLMYECQHSPITHRTYEYYHVLHNIRAQPECSAKDSVEYCVGYIDSPPYTTYLKQVETNFRCSGFCFNRSRATLASNAPRTLFSNAMYSTSCDGAAARDLVNSVMSVSDMFFCQGLCLIFVVVIIAMLKAARSRK